jgi:hypothetical protein
VGVSTVAEVTAGGCPGWHTGHTISSWSLAQRRDPAGTITWSGLVENTISVSDMSQQRGAKAVAAPVAEDSLAFFQALWFWIPASLGVWSAIIWAITRIV